MAAPDTGAWLFRAQPAWQSLAASERLAKHDLSVESFQPPDFNADTRAP